MNQMPAITHRCSTCRTLSSVPGICSFCDEWMTPIEEMAMADKPPAPAPDWPEAEPDSAGIRTVTKRQAPPKRTRKAKR